MESVGALAETFDQLRLVEPTSKDGASQSEIDRLQHPAYCSVPHLPQPVDEEAFAYRTIGGNTIRLLEILPGGDDDILQCQIRHPSLDANPCYLAMSYRWDTTQEHRSIYINGAALNVRPNVFLAMKSLKRLSKTPDIWPEGRNGKNILVWIDSVCIDQSDTSDRSHQVAMMGRIFSQARRVLIWLGLPTSEMHNALELLDESLDARPSLYQNGESPDAISRAMRLLQPVIELDYWRRIWIVQEVVLASELYLFSVDHYVRWHALTIELHRIMESNIGPWSKLAPLNAYTSIPELLDRRKRIYLESLRFVDILEGYCHYQCTDMRDKVYGLAHIWNLRAEVSFKPDYSRSLFDLVLACYAYFVETQPHQQFLRFCHVLLTTLGLERSCERLCAWLLPRLSPITSPEKMKKYVLSGDNGQQTLISSLSIRHKSAGQLYKIRECTVSDDTHHDFNQWICCALESNTEALSSVPSLAHFQELDERIAKKDVAWPHGPLLDLSTAANQSVARSGRVFVDNRGCFGVASESAVPGDVCHERRGSPRILLSRGTMSTYHEIVGVAYRSSRCAHYWRPLPYVEVNFDPLSAFELLEPSRCNHWWENPGPRAFVQSSLP